MACSKEDATVRETNTRVLYAATLLNFTSQVILMQATPMVVSRSMKGDAVATVAVLGRLSSLAALVEFVLNPVFANLSDAYGRKVFLLLAPAATIVMRGAVARFPGVTTVGAGRVVTGALVPAFFTASSAALGDMYASGSPQDVIAVQGNLQMLMGGSFIISGLLAGKLAARNIRLPFLVSVALGAMSLGVVLKGFRETLGPEDRRRASLRGANPLGFLRLFQGSPALARTSLVQGLSQFPVVLQDVDAAFGAKHRGWGPEENGRFVAGAGVVSTLAGRCTGQIVTGLGGQSHAVLAHISAGLSFFSLRPRHVLRARLAGCARRGSWSDARGGGVRAGVQTGAGGANGPGRARRGGGEHECCG
mmetsp:Transcript_31625/g.72338  ORF Transcript_31625/g.72338 Transcript_31625/m.72338 type:complete len:363 (+) Transcript_31625:37-1125(+)